MGGVPVGVVGHGGEGEGVVRVYQWGLEVVRWGGCLPGVWRRDAAVLALRAHTPVLLVVLRRDVVVVGVVACQPGPRVRCWSSYWSSALVTWRSRGALSARRCLSPLSVARRCLPAAGRRRSRGLGSPAGRRGW
jgi:hypothetical protein